MLGQSSLVSADDNNLILIATTTSTENSGLLDYMLPVAEQDTGLSFRTVSAGTGKALKMGEAGDVDVLLVHAKESELKFIEAGYGIHRKEIMFNDFIVVGPDDDPASIATESSAADVFEKISSNSAFFISRGDDSGTHKKELNLWQSIDIDPRQESARQWYREVGQGMGKTLQIANELRGYTLTDRATWIFSRDKLSMAVVFEGDKQLQNQYSVIVVNPQRHNVNYQGASKFSDWLISDKGQETINQYKIEDQQLFYANAQ